jgi:hypothetical protein
VTSSRKGLYSTVLKKISFKYHWSYKNRIGGKKCYYHLDQSFYGLPRFAELDKFGKNCLL